MGEIDDLYQEKVEIIENEFFENFKKGKKREEIVKDYQNKLEKARKEFEKKYNKKIIKDKALAAKIKKKKEKKEKYKHLEVEKFEFEFSGWEKFKMRFKIFWFNHSRFWRRNLSDKFPRFLLYWIYKIRLFIKHVWRETMRTKDNLWTGLKKNMIKLGKKTLVGLKKLGKSTVKLLRFILGKIIFWKKEEKKKEGGKEGEEKSAEEKNEEKGDKKEKEQES
jgi:hypothetical protein